MFLTGFNQWFLVTFFSLASMLLSGCVSQNGSRAESKTEGAHLTHAAVLRLPFPTTKRTSPIDPDVVSYSDYQDPLIRMNRVIFKFNDVTYRYILIPFSKGYVRLVPDPVQKIINNFFYNVKSPIYVVNDLLQGRFKTMGRNLLRFGINTTVGLLGLFDPAKTRFLMEREETHFKDTLTRYGVGYGFYLVLPILGISDARNSVSIMVDHFLNPITFLTENPTTFVIQGSDYFQEFAPNAENYITLSKESEDPYLFFRNLYLQGVQRDDAY